ncbi:ABC transporter related protein [Methanolacinia petrolearia DSM 11571]|uniref:ABC transporter related protein n=1 Tax=Methanolacinia petrolearia (strain DSM 11571 / OCM 486 / SEBR 4847) TaxID=679926 RepID=E1RKK1_METP4|nr:ABC transporter ATP-binding protein [Methanolacinia petrolearia]ADN35854.1 ABC transporter related protein [Methanolacinia petrolearia DSM 11571]
MITTDGLKKYYTMGDVEVRALNGVSIQIEKGEFVGLMGPSGSGKSTLLHMIGLLDRPTSGGIFIDDKDVNSLSDEQRTMFRLNKLGYVFQDYALIPELTVLENVCLCSMVRGEDILDYTTKGMNILNIIGLSERTGHLQRELSGGQQQRVAIARAMVSRPDILFADEPCANLDSVNSRMVLDLCKKINTEMNQTIVMVSHEDWHREYFDKVIYLKDGVVDSIIEM